MKAFVRCSDAVGSQRVSNKYQQGSSDRVAARARSPPERKMTVSAPCLGAEGTELGTLVMEGSSAMRGVHPGRIEKRTRGRLVTPLSNAQPHSVEPKRRHRLPSEPGLSAPLAGPAVPPSPGVQPALVPIALQPTLTGRRGEKRSPVRVCRRPACCTSAKIDSGCGAFASSYTLGAGATTDSAETNHGPACLTLVLD